MKTYTISEKSAMIEVINQCNICFVGIADADNYPYVFPMNFAYIDDEIVLHSAPVGSHLNLLAKNNKVSVAFCTDGKLVYQHPQVACSYRMDAKSVICKGEVTFVEEIDAKEQILNEFMRKYTDRPFTYSEPALRNVKVWKVKIAEMTAREFGQPHRK